MDTLGLLAAWIGVLSFLSAVLVVIAASFLLPRCQNWLARTSKMRAQHRLNVLVAQLEDYDKGPTNRQLADLLHLYGNLTITLIAAIGLLILSIEMLDLGPQLLSSMLPFDIDSKLLTRSTGVLTFVLDYLFILRLAYLGHRIWAKTAIITSGRAQQSTQQVLLLREQLGLSLPNERQRSAE